MCECMSLFGKVKSSASPEHSSLTKWVDSVGTLVISACLDMLFFLEGC